MEKITINKESSDILRFNLESETGITTIFMPQNPT